MQNNVNSLQKDLKKDLQDSAHQSQGNVESWRPGATITALKSRAELLAQVRKFFYEKGVLEVETPLLCRTAALDPHYHAIPALINHPQLGETKFYLQTSPEFAMKRMLAGGVGPIFQICKAFRDSEIGRLHNPEFTLLEWYRPGFDHHRLMDEMDELLQTVLGMGPAKRITYQDLFLDKLDFDPHSTTLSELQTISLKQDIHIHRSEEKQLNCDDYLNILLTHCIEPHLGFDAPVMIFDYPETQAALAKIRKRANAAPVAERFEVYVRGIELANGYHELTDAENQLKRFEADIRTRDFLGHSKMPIDMRLIEALSSGLPDCAGVALGMDRLLMLKENSKDIREMLSFTIDNA